MNRFSFHPCQEKAINDSKIIIVLSHNNYYIIGICVTEKVHYHKTYITYNNYQEEHHFFVLEAQINMFLS